MASPGADAPRHGTSVEAPKATATSTTTTKAGTSMADEALDGLPGWHRQVAIDTFNAAWELIDLPARTPASIASCWDSPSHPAITGASSGATKSTWWGIG